MPLTVTVLAVIVQVAAAAPGGQAVFEARCASCHVTDDPRVPSTADLRRLTADAILGALNDGAMRLQGSELTAGERQAVADYLAGPSSALATARPGACEAARPFDPSSGPRWSGWSPAPTNTRFQPAGHANLTAAQVPALRLKWAFGFPDASSARSLPAVAGGRLFVGSQRGVVYALDARTGCTIWAFQAKGGVQSAISIGGTGPGGRTLAYFGDGTATVYAVDAADGALVWSRRIDEHRFARITGAPTLYQDRLYVPVSSLEEGQGGNPRYECCTFRGSLVALDATSGALVWHTYVMDAAKPVGKNAAGATRWGPSGAAIWSAPTIDATRRVVYAATGNMYTEPQQPTSNAVLAFDLDTGRLVWTAQMTSPDVFVVGCGQRGGANCPEPGQLGPDHDFGNSPMLARRPGGGELIVIGQKSGIGWALDPDREGAVVWQYRAGRGGPLGGMEWGSAVDAERAYFPVADMTSPQPGGLHAVRLDSGDRVWYAPPGPPKCGAGTRGCNDALSAAITVVPGVVFVGSNDGSVRAHGAADGRVLWEYDTNREFETVNGVAARGASINGPGPLVVDGMLYVSSGYGALGGRPGNVLLAFGLE